MRLYNTLTQSKQAFEPIAPGEVRMYVCGVTVYDRSHIGHARSAIVFDVLRRYLEFSGLRVRFVRNFTDIDDKIINRANQEGVDYSEIVARYIAAYEDDMERLGVRRPTIEPRATEYIDAMIRLVQALVAAGHAYGVDGSVYFSVPSFGAYGRLSKRNLDELKVGARVEVDEGKRDPLDFALWKAAKPGEPYWDSPWGRGRPGWHIECSAMASALLGESFDIHGGGMDLVFPHHENEIAQSEAHTGKPFARFWIHNGFVNIDQEKMSKSLGNVFTIQEVLAAAPFPPGVTAEVLRYWMLSTHYRAPIDYSDDGLRAAKGALDNLYRVLQKLPEQRAPGFGDATAVEALGDELETRFRAAMDDDLNSPQALAALQQFRAAVNPYLERGITAAAAARLGERLRRLGDVLGLLHFSPVEWPESRGDRSVVPISTATRLTDTDVARLVEERNAARRARDFAHADAVRQQLAAAGVILEDRPDGSTRVRR